jgi:hypothetical protein
MNRQWQLGMMSLPAIAWLIHCSVAGAAMMEFDFGEAAHVEAGYQTFSDPPDNTLPEYQTNYGGFPDVRGNSPFHLLKGYVGIDISGLPAGAIVTSATFSIWSIAGDANAVNLFAIKDGTANEVFSSATITYENASGNSAYTEAGGSAAFVANNVGMNATEVVSLGDIGAGVTSSIQGNRTIYSVTFDGASLDFINNDTNGVATFALTPDVGTPGKGFRIDNNTETGLKLTYTIVPEPSSWALLILACSVLLLHRLTS